MTTAPDRPRSRMGVPQGHGIANDTRVQADPVTLSARLSQVAERSLLAVPRQSEAGISASWPRQRSTSDLSGSHDKPPPSAPLSQPAETNLLARRRHFVRRRLCRRTTRATARVLVGRNSPSRQPTGHSVGLPLLVLLASPSKANLRRKHPFRSRRIAYERSLASVPPWGGPQR
jgi:hypothetical protein